VSALTAGTSKKSRRVPSDGKCRANPQKSRFRPLRLASDHSSSPTIRGAARPFDPLTSGGFYKSSRSCLRNDHWYQKLAWSYVRAHCVSRIRFRQAKADFPLVLLAPASSMAPVLASTDMVAGALNAAKLADRKTDRKKF
jgi:hypothetical protein